MNKASWAKTTVVTPFGTFQFMPFGLKNAGATFQRIMDQIVGDLDFVFIYLHDILISLGTESEFFASELEFLGHIIKVNGIRPSPKHTAAVRDYPAPRSKEDISKFLGLLNFFRSFLPDATLLLQPMTSLMKKSAVFVWEKSQQVAFQQAKQALLNAVTLLYCA